MAMENRSTYYGLGEEQAAAKRTQEPYEAIFLLHDFVHDGLADLSFARKSRTPNATYSFIQLDAKTVS